MKTYSLPAGMGAAAGMLILILDSQTALEAARESVQFAIQTVIPSLFPFFFLSGWLTGSGLGSFRILSGVARLFHMPDGCSYLLLPAFLGGYPSGAQAIASAYQQGQLSKESAERLLGYCSNAGPSFLFGILTSCFPAVWMCWALWAIHIAGALLAARLLPAVSEDCIRISKIRKQQTMSDILLRSVKTTAIVCGWVILFRILIAFLERWCLWLVPQPIQVFLKGAIELTNGCCALNQILDVGLRFVLCAALLAMGGVCVTMQTKAVVRSLDLRYYRLGKGIQCAFSVIAASAILYRSAIAFFIPAAFLLLSQLKPKKRGSFPESLRV